MGSFADTKMYSYHHPSTEDNFLYYYLEEIVKIDPFRMFQKDAVDCEVADLRGGEDVFDGHALRGVAPGSCR